MGVKSDHFADIHEPIWRVPDGTLVLSSEDAHLWRIDLDLDPPDLRTLASTLSPAEQARAARFFRAIDRDHFTAARGALREILGRYLAIEPRAIEFSYNPYGKPALAYDPDANALTFNLSHSGGIALLAVTKARAIGVDLEQMRDDFASLEIAKRFFSSRETAALETLPPEEQTSAFFHCWTRKEAYIKALGEGLSRSLQGFSVSIDHPAALLEDDSDPEAATRWSLIDVFPGDGFAGAAAIEGSVEKVLLWEWERRQ